MIVSPSDTLTTRPTRPEDDGLICGFPSHAVTKDSTAETATKTVFLNRQNCRVFTKFSFTFSRESETNFLLIIMRISYQKPPPPRQVLVIEIFSVHFSAHNPPRMCYTTADSFVYPDPLSESAKKSQQRTGQVRAIWRGLSVSVG